MDTVIYPKEQVIVTHSGIFKLNIVKNKDRNTDVVSSYSIHIGGKHNKCFNMRIPSRQVNETDGYLSWVEAHDECSFEQYIEKGLAQHMVLLGLTIARDINPNLKIVRFEDISNITCKFPDGTEQKVPLKPFHIAFHQATWYEYYFDAKLDKDYHDYVKLKYNFKKPKPDIFDFRNDELQKKLEPLYNQTNTWEEFFDLIAKTYGRNKCTVLYPWLNSALYTIFEDNPYFESIKWHIDLEDNKRKNKTAPIYFESYEYKKSGGGRKTRKVRRQTSFRTYLQPNVPKVSQWKYREFLEAASK